MPAAGAGGGSLRFEAGARGVTENVNGPLMGGLVYIYIYFKYLERIYIYIYYGITSLPSRIVSRGISPRPSPGVEVVMTTR